MKRQRMPIAVKRIGNRFVPISRFDERLLTEQPEGVVVEVYVQRKRSVPQLRKYWATLNSIVENTKAGNVYPTAEHLHASVKLALGYTTEVMTMDGVIIQIPDSIAFDKMDAAAFREFFDKAAELLTRLAGFDVLLEAA